MSEREEFYMRGWRAAIEEVAKMLRSEANACIADILPGDPIGAREANARAGALLTAEADARARIDKITILHRDFIDLSGGPSPDSDQRREAIR